MDKYRKQIEELKVNHENEVTKIMREDNIKYQKLFTEKVQSEESLKVKFENDKKKLIKDFDEKMNIEINNLIEKEKIHQEKIVGEQVLII